MSEGEDKDPEDRGPAPSVYARLREDATRRWHPQAPPRWARPAGWVVIAAIIVVIVIAVRGGAG